jgi:hypothetical protein
MPPPVVPAHSVPTSFTQTATAAGTAISPSVPLRGDICTLSVACGMCDKAMLNVFF